MSKKEQLENLKRKLSHFDNSIRDIVVLANFAKNVEGANETEYYAVLKGIATIGLLTIDIEDEE